MCPYFYGHSNFVEVLTIFLYARNDGFIYSSAL